MQVPKPVTFEPNSTTLPQDVAAIPASHGIYSLAIAGHAPHIGWSINLRRRLARLLVPSYTAVQSVSYWGVGSKLETAFLLYELTRASYPDSYLRRLHLRSPWFIGLMATDSFGRLEVSNRLSGKEAVHFGPFRTRDTAELLKEQLLSLHQLRRCTETLDPTPDHPGCIYGEMNQCLRPCQCKVSLQEYASECSRVHDFLTTAGKSALQSASAARERAAAELDFEQAAVAHKRVEKVQAAISVRDKVVTAVQHFNGVALTRAAESESVNLWPMSGGLWQPPVHLKLEREARSLDSMLRECLQPTLESPSALGNRLEHMALFSRWYYSSWRDGDWFAFETPAQLNYRRLVRAISDMFKQPVKNA